MYILCEFSFCRTGNTSTPLEHFASTCQPDTPAPCSPTCPAEAYLSTATGMGAMTPSDTGWRMNSDTCLPTAPARTTPTRQPANTESAVRMHANQTYVEAVRIEDSGPDSVFQPRSP